MAVKTTFIPIGYDYFDFEGKNYAKIIGRDDKGKRICIIDSCPVYLWAILREGLNDKKISKLIKKIEKIKIHSQNRETKIEKVEVCNKNFLGKPIKALKIYATNYKDLHSIADKLDFLEIEKRRGYDLGFITHYIRESELIPFSFYYIEGEMLNNSSKLGGIDSKLNVDLCIKADSIKPIKEKINKLFKPIAAAYDIETNDLGIGKGEILMVSIVGNEGTKKVITWKKDKSSKKLPNYVEFVKSEAELIEAFCESIKKISPDFLIGYNSDGFDLPYLKSRAEKHGIKLSLGIDSSQPRFSGGAGIKSGKIFGIVHIDIFRFIRTAYSQYMQSETLSLNEVSKEFLGDEKKDFSHRHATDLRGVNWNDYYEYNLHDSVLALGLFEKFFPDIQEFSKTIQEPPYDTSRYGLSRVLESYILHNLNKFNEIPEKRPSHEEIGKRKFIGPVEGAFVFQPKPGLYENIVMFDFTAMHTSIIISMNLSKSTLLERKQSNSIASPDLELSGKKQKFYFQKSPGFFPEMMKEIFEIRKRVKSEYKKNPNPITNARNNAFKVLSASAHGYVAFFGARYHSKEASASILAFVRQFNKETIKKVEKAGYEVVYADSVGGKTKVIIKENGRVKETFIENLFKKRDKKNHFGKEYNFKKYMEVLTLDKKGKSVFKPITYVMRHNCNKKMYRVHFTNNWHIDVTEDHSLIGYQATRFNQSKKNKENPLRRLIEIKPTEIKNKVNSIICLQKIPLKKKNSKKFPKEVYEFMGFFIGDGSFARNKQHTKSNKDYYLRLSLGKDKKEVINKLINPLIKKKYIKNYRESKTRQGDISLNGLNFVKIISKFCRNKKGGKTVPKWIFEEKEENIASFLKGLFSADGCVMIRNNAPIIKYTSTKESCIKEVRNLLYRVGISHSVFKENTANIYKAKGKTYSNRTYSKNIIIKDVENFQKKIGFLLGRKNKRGNIKTKPQQNKYIKKFEFDLQGVKKIECIKLPKYVYDIEVKDTHRFFANKVLVHNTDSVAFTREKHSKKEVKNLLQKLNSELPGVMELELEDFYKRGIWVTKRSGEFGAKKKYALLDEKGKLKVRGFETVRRDWCKLAREVQNNVIKQILKDGNEKKAIEYVKKIIKQVKSREIPRELMIIKTQLKKPLSEYKAISPHVIAARKMKEQKIPISEGGLIEYFIEETKPGTKTKLVREKVKLPEETGKYNIQYYLERQILPAVENIFQIFNIDIKEIIDGKKQTTLGDF